MSTECGRQRNRIGAGGCRGAAVIVQISCWGSFQSSASVSVVVLCPGYGQNHLWSPYRSHTDVLCSPAGQ